MVIGFFQGDYLHRDITTTLLTLIPKIDKPKSLADYRPISLASFASKLISKILASRLATILPLIVNGQQYGFVQGRSIHEYIALAQEMVLDLDRKTDGFGVPMLLLCTAYFRNNTSLIHNFRHGEVSLATLQSPSAASILHHFNSASHFHLARSH